MIINMNSIQELPAKAVIQVVSGRASTGPKDVLFAKWKENWESIQEQVTEEDPLNTYDWEASGSAQRLVALGIKQWAITVKEDQHFSRGDYDTALNLVLLYLGHHVRCKIPRPCNVSLMSI